MLNGTELMPSTRAGWTSSYFRSLSWMDNGKEWTSMDNPQLLKHWLLTEENRGSKYP